MLMVLMGIVFIVIGIAIIAISVIQKRKTKKKNAGVFFGSLFLVLGFIWLTLMFESIWNQHNSADSDIANNNKESATGYDSISAVTGKNSVSSTEGMHSISGTTGCYSVSSATGNHSVSVTTEEESVSSANGYGCVSTTTGRDSFASVESDTGIAVAWGYKSKAKGCIGSRLVLADWKCVRYTLNEEDAWQLVGAKMVIVDGVNIKADTYYRCINGEVVEAIDEDE